jgi:small subunit ribosomal protein S21
MAQIILGENEGIESALRRFKRKVSRAGIFPDMKKYRHFERSGSERRWRGASNAGRILVVDQPPGGFFFGDRVCSLCVLFWVIAVLNAFDRVILSFYHATANSVKARSLGC